MINDPNLPLLERVATTLKPLLDDIVFVGGIAVGLLITDNGAASIRQTEDVDVIAEIATPADYILFSERLRRLQYTEDMTERPILCRWHYEEITLDVIPVAKEILGFTNMWYKSAFHKARPITLPSGMTISVIAAPFFLATKVEAFWSRGKNDYFSSRDLEDFIAVVDGRPSLLEEITKCPLELQHYLAGAAKELLSEERFLDAIPGYVLGDEERAPLILRTLGAITRLP